MPQACITWMPFARNHSIIARGAADPPIVTYFSLARPEPVRSMCSIMPSQTVGTPAEWLTSSSR